MVKEKIKKLLEDSKRVLDDDFTNSEKSVKDDLNNFKKKALDRI